MPTLRQKQHEAFCQAYAHQPNAAEAAKSAGYEFGNRYQAGSRLLRRPTVAARIAELRAEIVERECLTAPALLAKLEHAYAEAIKAGQPAAAVRVIELQAKLGGLLPVAASRAGLPARAAEPDGATTAADPTRFPPPLPQPDEAARAALAAVARSRARKRSRA